MNIIGTSLDGCWAHFSPRVRVWLTSSPTYGGHGKIKIKGRRVALMSDTGILKVLRGLGCKLGRELSIKILNHPTPFIFVQARNAYSWLDPIIDCRMAPRGKRPQDRFQVATPRSVTVTYQDPSYFREFSNISTSGMLLDAKRTNQLEWKLFWNSKRDNVAIPIWQ